MHTACTRPDQCELQVCKRWRDLLEEPATQQHLWQEIVVDFGHELITAVHTPMKWSDKRPSDDEFRTAFQTTRLSSVRIIDFIEARRKVVRSLVFRNSEGYFSGAQRLLPEPACSPAVNKALVFGLSRFPQSLQALVHSGKSSCTAACLSMRCCTAANADRRLQVLTQCLIAEEGELVSLLSKHNFSLGHFGMALGPLRSTLRDLQVRLS